MHLYLIEALFEESCRSPGVIRLVEKGADENSVPRRNSLEKRYNRRISAFKYKVNRISAEELCCRQRL